MSYKDADLNKGVISMSLAHPTTHEDISLRTGTVGAILMIAGLNCHDNVPFMDNNVYYTNSYIYVLQRKCLSLNNLQRRE